MAKYFFMPENGHKGGAVFGRRQVLKAIQVDRKVAGGKKTKFVALQGKSP